jgi:hypothetical protein
VLISIFVFSLLGFSGCAFHSGLTSNLNQNTTQVVLSTNNYKIIAKVKGTASGISVLGIGGSFKPLIERARAEMLENASIVGSSKAVINETVEVNNKNYAGIVNQKTVTVSAYVIEFK